MSELPAWVLIGAGALIGYLVVSRLWDFYRRGAGDISADPEEEWEPPPRVDAPPPPSINAPPPDSGNALRDMEAHRKRQMDAMKQAERDQRDRNR